MEHNSTKAPWGDGPHPSEVNVPHAFVPHKDVMSPTGAPWAQPSQPDLKLSSGKPVSEVVKSEPRMPAKAETTAQQQWEPARKKIQTGDDLKRFLESEAVKDFVAFILSLNEGITGKKLSEKMHVSEAVQKLADVIDTLGVWVDEIPPMEQSLRYGNPSFRTWFARLAEQGLGLMQSVLPDPVKQAAIEITPYFIDSFGNPTRIDYGTGHETTFCALLYCFARLGVFTSEDRQALVGLVFNKYLNLMRRIQTTYW